jgi:hypothetical protein
MGKEFIQKLLHAHSKIWSRKGDIEKAMMLFLRNRKIRKYERKYHRELNINTPKDY